MLLFDLILIADLIVTNMVDRLLIFLKESNACSLITHKTAPCFDIKPLGGHGRLFGLATDLDLISPDKLELIWQFQLRAYSSVTITSASIIESFPLYTIAQVDELRILP